MKYRTFSVSHIILPQPSDNSIYISIWIKIHSVISSLLRSTTRTQKTHMNIRAGQWHSEGKFKIRAISAE